MLNYEKKFFYKKYKNFILYKGNYSQKKDLELTLKTIKKKKIDTLILDNYYLGKNWCSEIRKKVNNFIILDDGLKKNYECDLYVNSNYFVNKKKREDNKLLGLNYFILNQRYLKTKSSKIIYDIFINLGTGKFKLALKKLLFNLNRIKKLKHIIVIGNYTELIKDLSNKIDYKISFLKNYKNLEDYIMKSKLCIGAAGTNLFERLYLNKKNIVFSTAKHQIKISNFLLKNKLINYMGKIDNMNKMKILTIINKNVTRILNDNNKTKLNIIIDGKGAKRIAVEINKLKYKHKLN